MMWIVLHPLVIVFLFSPSWRSNGHLIPGTNIKWNHKQVVDHQKLPHNAHGPSGLRDNPTDAGIENVVSLLSMQVQHAARASNSEQRTAQARISSEDVLYWRRKRDIDDGQNLTTVPVETRMQIKQEEATTLHTSLTPQAASFLFESLTEPTKTLRPDSLQDERTTRRLSGMEDKTQETTQEIPPTSVFMLFYAQTNKTDMDRNKTSFSDLHTIQPTLDTTVQPGPMTHTPTSTETFVTDFKGTESIKTTQRDEITDEQINDSELKTSAAAKPVKTTTLKTTTTRVVPLPQNKQQSNPGPAVAAVITTTFVLMFIAIIAILVRKRKIQKKQLENPEWAGPSPFLDGNDQPNLPNMVESESINRGGFNQISISRYLPQRLSKHLTPQRDTNEEVFMGDILQGSTFGRQNLTEIQARNGEPTVGQGLPKTEENQNHQASVDSGDTKTPGVMVDNQDSSTQNEDLTASSSQEPAIKALIPLVSIDLDSLSEETAPSQTTDVETVPPAPPLP